MSRAVGRDDSWGYYRGRWYITSAGRFANEDPIRWSAGDQNLYRYVGNSPTNATDPSGLILGIPDNVDMSDCPFPSFQLQAQANATAAQAQANRERILLEQGFDPCANGVQDAPDVQADLTMAFAQGLDIGLRGTVN